MQKFLHALNCVPGMHYKILAKLYEKFSNWRHIWESADVEALLSAGLNKEMTLKILRARNEFDTDAAMAYLWENDVVILTKDSAEYPELLKQISDAPFVLYRKGAALNSKLKHIAMVGTRKPSAYGEKIAHDLATAFAAQDATIVSGLALGIDAITHFGAVSQKKPTVAVLASGIGEVTPYCHEQFAEKILESGGSILSEYPPCDPPFQGRFLQRNRLISGLSQATVIIEAGIKSGALSTAYHAVRQKRQLFALCGDINRPQAYGCLKLINNGSATPITNIDDILKQLGFSPTIKNKSLLSPEEDIFMELLRQCPLSTQELIEKTFIAPNRVSVILSKLELKGLIQRNRELLWEAV